MTTPIEDDGLPDLQQRLVDALYGPGWRRSETVEELADALIAVAALRSSPAVDGVGPVAFVTPETMKDILAQSLWTQGAVGEFRCDNREGFTVPLYAEPPIRSAISPTSDRASVVEECAKVVDDLADGAARAAEIYGAAEQGRTSNNNRKGAFQQAAHSIRRLALSKEGEAS